MLRWLKRGKNRPNKADTIWVPDVTFITEQDGDAERELKSRLTEHFKSYLRLNEAYLVRVRYGSSPEIKVALCLDTGGKVDAELVQAAASEFPRIFGSHESLDIMFLKPEERERISAVAKSFYSPSPYRV
jgi:hypothetical protein